MIIHQYTTHTTQYNVMMDRADLLITTSRPLRLTTTTRRLCQAGMVVTLVFPLVDTQALQTLTMKEWESEVSITKTTSRNCSSTLSPVQGMRRTVIYQETWCDDPFLSDTALGWRRWGGARGERSATSDTCWGWTPPPVGSNTNPGLWRTPRRSWRREERGLFVLWVSGGEEGLNFHKTSLTNWYKWDENYSEMKVITLL